MPKYPFLLVAVALLSIQIALAENLSIDDANIQYTYSYKTVGSLHFCDLATVMAKAPMVIKLTAAFVTDDTKPKDKDVTVAYIVEAFGARVGKNKQLESMPIKVVAGRVISDIFNSDLHATKMIDKGGLGASYAIQSVDSVSSFTNVLTLRGEYTLAVEFENHSILVVNVHPTPKLLDASEKWSKCTIDIMQHRTPQ